MKVYHNPRCQKSRETLSFLEKKGIEYEIKFYLKDSLSIKDVTALVKKLKMKPIELVRKNEKIWREKYLGKNLISSDIIEAIVLNPKLMQRPIIEYKNLAVLCRPVNNILSLLK